MSRLRKLSVAALLVAVVGFAAIASRTDTGSPPTQTKSTPAAAVSDPAAGGARPKAEPVSISRAALRIAAERSARIRQSLPSFDPAKAAMVPFAAFADGRLRATLRIRPDTLEASLDLEGGGELRLPPRRVPVALVDAGADTAVVVAREVFSGRLWLYRYAGQLLADGAAIASRSDAQPILRAATMHDGQLVAVLYDNARSLNEVVTLALPQGWDGPEIRPIPVLALASLEDPAGGTYEMIPTVRLLATNGRLFALGGTLLQEIRPDHPEGAASWRMPGCLRAQDAVFKGDLLRVLCLSRAQGADQPYESAAMVVTPGLPVFRLLEWSIAEGFREVDTVDDALVSLTPQGELNRADHHAALRRLLVEDLQANHASGVMELGINNLEGRVAWSQIYFLNGLMDLLSLALSDDIAADLWQPLLGSVRQRLDIEIHLLDRLMDSEYGFRTKAFTVGREPAIFAVQTSRLLLLFNRYTRLFPDGLSITSLPQLRRSVLSLDGHIDALITAGPDSTEPAPGRRYLHWPKGSAFYFDGLNVPYNHQNEWAYAVFDTLKSSPAADDTERNASDAAHDIVHQFLAAVAPRGEMPASGMWPYWWGKAREGWTAGEGISQNRPAYPGDRLTAWISFRSIDVMTVLAAGPYLTEARQPKLRDSIAALVHAGLLYPFVAAGFETREPLPLANRAAALAYARMTAPSDLQNAVYAYYALARTR